MIFLKKKNRLLNKKKLSYEKLAKELQLLIINKNTNKYNSDVGNNNTINKKDKKIRREISKDYENNRIILIKINTYSIKIKTPYQTIYDNYTYKIVGVNPLARKKILAIGSIIKKSKKII